MRQVARSETGHSGVKTGGFTGHKHNAYIKLIDMRARWYDSAIGRFASADTLVPDPTNPQQFNRYSYVLNNALRYTDPTGHSCYNPTMGSPCVLSDGAGNSPLPRSVPRETRNGIPKLIKEADPFDTIPFDPAVCTSGGIQGFGDTQFSSKRRYYGVFGFLHPGVDIPLPVGTPLLALGDGYVTCGALQTSCGQQRDPTGNGHGIGIYYYSCNCVVYYTHATDVLVKDTPVLTGQVVGYSGAGSDGYAHLHLEIRNVANTMVYNPIYFFEENTWNKLNLAYMPYANRYGHPETRVYAIMMSTGFDYWNWRGSYPFVFVR